MYPNAHILNILCYWSTSAFRVRYSILSTLVNPKMDYVMWFFLAEPHSAQTHDVILNSWQPGVIARLQLEFGRHGFSYS